MTARLQVALLFGGRSGEHEVSLVSAASVAAGLAARHDVVPVLIDKAGRWLFQEGREPRPAGGEPVFLAPVPGDGGRLRRLADAREIARPDAFFPVLHGTYGEDGTVQGLFELAGVPYVGAGVAASAASMDKAMMKALFARAGLPQVEYRVLLRRDPAAEARVLDELSLPVFVKPANLGSSVAVAKVKSAGELAPALDAAFAYDRKVVVEKGVLAREIEVAILGNDTPDASVPGEIVPDREFYDYDSKYSADSRTELFIPARVDAAMRAGRATAGHRRVPGGGRRGPRAGRLLPRAVDGAPPGERDQHPPGLHLDQHVPEAVGGERRSLPGPARAARRARARASRRARPPAHRLRFLRRRAVGAPRTARALLAAAALAPTVPALASSAEAPGDLEARAALSLVYDGDFHGAESRLAALARARAADPVLPYLQALALEWRLEQDPADRTHDAEVLALADRALGLSASCLGRDPSDRRALLARGAAHGVKSRLHLFRWEKGPASREAVRMREALVAARDAGEKALDLDFGLGLYDYYADTLPRFFKVVAFVLRIPGGDRERGIDALARVARGGSTFHDDEARVQMYDVHSFFERKPDRALHWIREMWRLHPGWPIWGLKLAQLLGEPMGLWGESAAVARQVLATAEEGRHPNYQPVVAAMARALLAEALLGDLRFEEACATARGMGAGTKGAGWAGERAGRVLERCRALERDPGSAEARGLALLAQARRLRERGEVPAAEADVPPRLPGLSRERRGAPVRGAGEPARGPAGGGARPRAGRARGRDGAVAAALRLPRARAGARGRGRARRSARRLPRRLGGPSRASRPARRGGGGRLPPRPRRVASRGAGAGALRSVALRVFKLPYKNHSSRPVPHIFVGHGGRAPEDSRFESLARSNQLQEPL